MASRLRRSSSIVELGSGDDRVRLLTAFNVIGGAGDDSIVVARGAGILEGGPGDDRMRVLTAMASGGYAENTPCLNYRTAPRPVHVNFMAGRATGQGRDEVTGFRCVNGSRYDDLLVGSQRGEAVAAGAGSDIVQAGEGPDGASGGAGSDRIYLGDGFDYGNGDAGRDRLYGQAGPDVLEGWTQSDYLEGGHGNDQVYGAIFCAIGGNSYDTGGALDGAPDELFGGDGADYLVGDRGNDRIDGGSGYDWAQPGHRDGRIDWVEQVEAFVDGCLENVSTDQPLDPSQAKDTRPW